MAMIYKFLHNIFYEITAWFEYKAYPKHRVTMAEALRMQERLNKATQIILHNMPGQCLNVPEWYLKQSETSLVPGVIIRHKKSGTHFTIYEVTKDNVRCCCKSNSWKKYFPESIVEFHKKGWEEYWEIFGSDWHG